MAQNRSEQLSFCMAAGEFVLRGRKLRKVLISSHQAFGSVPDDECF